MGEHQQRYEITVGDLLVFTSPVRLDPAETQGIDTLVAEWHGEDLLVRTDYGLFVDMLSGYRDRPRRQVFEETIDGLPARGVAFDQEDGSRFTAVHFHDLSPVGAGPRKLTFVAISGGSITDEEVLLMARSIRFRR